MHAAHLALVGCGCLESQEKEVFRREKKNLFFNAFAFFNKTLVRSIVLVMPRPLMTGTAHLCTTTFLPPCSIGFVVVHADPGCSVPPKKNVSSFFIFIFFSILVSHFLSRRLNFKTETNLKQWSSCFYGRTLLLDQAPMFDTTVNGDFCFSKGIVQGRSGRQPEVV
jgi:hypothetical protein